MKKLWAIYIMDGNYGEPLELFSDGHDIYIAGVFLLYWG